MRRYESGGVIQLTPELALEWLERFRYGPQRPLNKSGLRQIERQMRRGEFRRSTITFHVVNGQKVLTNGQHRVVGVLNTNCTIDAQLEYIHCDTWEEVKDDYCFAIDNSTARSGPAIDKGFGLAERSQLPQIKLMAVKAATGVLMSGFALDYYSTHELASDKRIRTKATEEWLDEGQVYFDTVLHHDTNIPAAAFRNKTLTAIALALFREQPKKAYDFFDAFSRYSHDQGDGPHQLAVVLSGVRFANVKGVLEISRIIARCWNAFWDSKTPIVRSISRTAQELKDPILLKGTAYDGEHVVYWTPKGYEAPQLKQERAA